MIVFAVCDSRVQPLHVCVCVVFTLCGTLFASNISAVSSQMLALKLTSVETKTSFWAKNKLLDV